MRKNMLDTFIGKEKGEEKAQKATKKNVKSI